MCEPTAIFTEVTISDLCLLIAGPAGDIVSMLPVRLLFLSQNGIPGWHSVCSSSMGSRHLSVSILLCRLGSILPPSSSQSCFFPLPHLLSGSRRNGRRCFP